MTEFRFYTHGLCLLALAWSCAPPAARAQLDPSAPASPPVKLERKDAARLLLSKLKPEYPAVAKVNYIRGHVDIEIVVARDGRVIEAHVLHGNPILAASALKAVHEWVYRPLLTPGGPAAFVTQADLNFKMNLHGVDLGPERAERDLTRQVKPPEVITRTSDFPPAVNVQVRLLVNDRGEMMDCELQPGAAGDLEAAQRTLQAWTFRPARWGTLAIPWYLDLDVPIAASAVTAQANGLGRR